MAFSIEDLASVPVSNFMNVTLRAAGSTASFLANRLGLEPKFALALVPDFTIASSLTPSVRTYAGALFNTETRKTL